MAKKRKSEDSQSVDLSALGRTPPHDLEAERGVIGSLLLVPDLCDDVLPMLTAENFYSDAHRRLYRNIIEMRNDQIGIDILLLRNRLQKSEELEAVGGEAYLAELVQSVHVTAHATHYAKIVHEKALLRKLIDTSATALQNAFEPETSAKELLNKASQQMFELCESQTTNQVVDLYTLVLETSSYLDMKMSGKTDGLSTGFADLDNVIDGLHPNELIIVAARPSMGKTAFATNIAENVAINHKLPVLMVSLEMSRLELGLRLVCSRGRIDSNKIRKNFMSQSDKDRFAQTCGAISKAPLYIDDTPSRTVMEIAAVARRLKTREDLRLLVIDYLSLIEPESSDDSRQEQVAKNARRLKTLARELKIPILCLAQLNRQAEEMKDHRPRLSHLRESGAIEQDADVVMFVHREEKYVPRETAEEKGLIGQAEIIVAKQRNGPTEDVKLTWVGEYTRFMDLSRHNEEAYAEVGEEGNKVF